MIEPSLRLSHLDRRRFITRPGVLIWTAAFVLLLPAILIGRPFVYWDTPTFYGWGHDILQAIRHHWPPLSDFPDHRGLWAADNFPGAWDRITSQQYQLVLTSIGARSSFYALPFFALGSTVTLWAPALVQSLLAAWLLWLTTTVTLQGRRPFAYARLIAVLTATTTAPFIVAFLMPDVFAAYALLTTALLLCFHQRLSRGQRVGCAVLLAYAVVVHLSILPVVVAMLLVGLVALRFLTPGLAVRPGASIAVAALVGAGLAATASGIGMKAIFGEDIRSPPFLEGRVIADGPGQQFLRETCAERHWAACVWKDLRVVTTDDIIWPDLSWHNLPRITDPAERRRFLDEQAAFVFGTVLHHPLAQLRSSVINAGRQLATFTIAGDVGGSLYGLLGVHTDRTMRVTQIVPNIAPCLTADAHACDDTQRLKRLQLLQYATVAIALLVLAVCLLRRTAPLGTDADGETGQGRLTVFAFTLVSGVVLNAIVCGACSGAWGRYQARVVWLVPMAAMLLLEHLLQSARDRERIEGRAGGLHGADRQAEPPPEMIARRPR